VNNYYDRLPNGSASELASSGSETAGYQTRFGRFSITVSGSSRGRVKLLLEKLDKYVRKPVSIAVYSYTPKPGKGRVEPPKLVLTKRVSPSVTHITVPAKNPDDITIVSFEPASGLAPAGAGPKMEFGRGFRGWRSPPAAIAMEDIREQILRSVVRGYDDQNEAKMNQNGINLSTPWVAGGLGILSGALVGTVGLMFAGRNKSEAIGTSEEALTLLKSVYKPPMSQRKLADQLGMKSHSSVKEWLSGRRSIPKKHWANIESLAVREGVVAAPTARPVPRPAARSAARPAPARRGYTRGQVSRPIYSTPSAGNGDRAEIRRMLSSGIYKTR